MRVLGVNAVFHDSAAAVVVGDGCIVAATDGERSSGCTHRNPPLPLSSWETPARAVPWRRAEAGLEPANPDAAVYSYDPTLAIGPFLARRLARYPWLAA